MSWTIWSMISRWEIFSSPKRLDQLWAHPASCSIHTGALPLEVKWQDMKLTTQHHLVPRLRMSGAGSFLSLCAFMVCTGTALPFMRYLGVFRGILCWSFDTYCKNATVSYGTDVNNTPSTANKYPIRFEVFRVMMIHTAVFWVMTPCFCPEDGIRALVSTYQTICRSSLVTGNIAHVCDQLMSCGWAGVANSMPHSPTISQCSFTVCCVECSTEDVKNSKFRVRTLQATEYTVMYYGLSGRRITNNKDIIKLCHCTIP
jgi:hypothetical protein